VIRRRLAVIGYGQLGHACVSAVRDCQDLELAGVVRRGAPMKLPSTLEHVAVAGHLRELSHVDAALVCVPAEQVLGVAREILQQHVPVVECAMLEGPALEAHHLALGVAARHHHAAAVVGAGWEPGALPLLQRLFDVLIPRGHTETGLHPGISLHHSALGPIPGVRDALACERRTPDGRKQHYVYVELDGSKTIQSVEQAIAADPLYAGEETLVFAVPDLTAVETAGAGIVLKRMGTGHPGAHHSLLLEARFDVAAFAANVMLDAARRLPRLKPGAHVYALWL
jgi:diaminopimelate dehydrogenase